MPHVEMPDSRNIRKAAVEKHGPEPEGQPHFLNSRQLEALLTAHLEERIIGKGTEAVVTSIQGEERKVAAYVYSKLDRNPTNVSLTAQEAKKIFYAHRIFSTLFPHNFPRFYAAFGDSDLIEGEDGLASTASLTGTIRQKILDPKSPAGKDKPIPFREVEPYIDWSKKGGSVAKYPFSKVETAARKMGGILMHDANAHNFIVGVDGGEYYLDNLLGDKDRLLRGREKVLQYMKDNNYSDEDQKLVATAFERLQIIKDQTTEEAAK